LKNAEVNRNVRMKRSSRLTEVLRRKFHDSNMHSMLKAVAERQNDGLGLHPQTKISPP
jgi:hypothetical protein